MEKSRVDFCWEAEVGTVLGTAHELDATGKDAKCQTLDLLQIRNSMFTEVVNRNNVCDMSVDRVRIFSNPNCADFYFGFVARDICVLENSCSETADVRKLSLLNLSVLNDTHFVLGRSNIVPPPNLRPILVGVENAIGCFCLWMVVVKSLPIRRL